MITLQLDALLLEDGKGHLQHSVSVFKAEDAVRASFPELRGGPEKRANSA
jgi:hypothetical protein